MYTEKNLKAATEIIRRIALENNVAEAQVRADMEAAISCGMNDPDPAVQARWTSFHYAGTKPTPEEFILWAASLQSKDHA